MYPLGHFGVAQLFVTPIAAVLNPRTQTGFTVYALLATWFPDFDIYLPELVHHGVTHTFTFAVIAGVAGGGSGGRRAETDWQRVCCTVRPNPGLHVRRIGTLPRDRQPRRRGYPHSPTQPVSPFWPLSHQTYQFGITHFGAPIRNAVLVLVGLTLHAVISWRTPPEGGITLSYF